MDKFIKYKHYLFEIMAVITAVYLICVYMYKIQGFDPRITNLETKQSELERRVITSEQSTNIALTKIQVQLEQLSADTAVIRNALIERGL